MPKRKTTVRKHPRRLQSGKITSVKRHPRNIDIKTNPRKLKKYTTKTYTRGEYKKGLNSINDIKETSKSLLQEYSKKKKIPANYFNLSFSDKPLKTFRGAESYAIRKGRWISINIPTFNLILQKNPEDAEKMLKFVLAHEVSHYGTKIEELADWEAEKLTGISSKEFDRLDRKYLKDIKKLYH